MSKPAEKCSPTHPGQTDRGITILLLSCHVYAVGFGTGYPFRQLRHVAIFDKSWASVGKTFR